ncbi:glycoside hydrolase family 28 protein [Chitinophagaceae bacterium MMS25-I14]
MNRYFTGSRSILLCLSLSLCQVFTTSVSQAQTPSRPASYYLKQATFSMPEIQEPTIPAHDFSISDYGAKGDGVSLNTEAFEKAMNACAAAGGGHVIVPPGTWLTGPIKMQSNIDLHVERGALILFTPDHTQYPIVSASGSSKSFAVASPVYGYDLSNISITGEGIMDGSGDSWRPVKKGKVPESQWKKLQASGGVVSKDGSIWWPSQAALDGEKLQKDLKKNKEAKAEDYLPARDYMRPYMVYFSNCKKVLIEGVTLRNSPKFIFYPTHCTDLTVRRANIFNEYYAQNGDGLDISACKNVLIYQCNVSVGDDGICMKSSAGSKDEPGSFNLENVVVAECAVYHAHGGFVIGSNTDGGMRNILVSNCNFVGTDAGIRVKSNAGRGGLVNKIYINDIYMTGIVNEAIVFDTYYEDQPAGSEGSSSEKEKGKVPQFEDFYLNRIYCTGAQTAISVTGLPEMPIKRIYLDNAVISAKEGVHLKDAADISFKGLTVNTAEQPLYKLEKAENITLDGKPVAGK